MREGELILFTPGSDVAARAAEQAARFEQQRIERIARTEAALDSAAEYHRLPRARAERVIRAAEPRRWAVMLGGGRDRGRAAADFGLDFAALACAQGDHEEEVRLAEAVAREVETDEDATYGLAWARLVRARGHLLDAASIERRDDCAEQLRGAAEDGIRDMVRRYGAVEIRRSSVLRAAVDSLAAALGRAQDLLGLPPSEPVADMRRRQRASAQPRRDATFFSQHKEGIVAVWGRDRREWLRQRYLAGHGTEPPEGWWIERSDNPSGGTVAPGMMRAVGVFDLEQQRAFFDEMEARYRAGAGLPQKGEGWVTQAYLARCVEAALPNHEVLREASPDWLGAQRFDIYVPSLALAIEYQGEQHYHPLDHWGAEQGLADRQVMDDRKREACLAAGITLVEWHYDQPVSVEAVRSRLAELGHGSG